VGNTSITEKVLTKVLKTAIISKNDITINDIPIFDTRMVLMMSDKNVNKYLPLTEATYYIMLSLIEPLHGYRVMQKVKEISEETVKVGPGTLYGVFSTLEKEGLIVKVREEERRKCYALTPKGQRVLIGQIERLEIMNANGSSVRELLLNSLDGRK
jgi:DNA-binding PadR family transcriptional regulator